MIISKTDVFLFQKMGMMLLASGQNKSSLRVGIQKLKEHLNHARSDGRDPNYVQIEQTPELNNNINKVFNDTFIGCDTAWKDINAQVKFSIIISTFWNKCFNSLWKLEIAAFNENARESSGIERSSLPTGVREYEYFGLRALAKSITNCCNDATLTKFGQEKGLLQSLESSRKAIELQGNEAQLDVEDLKKQYAETKKKFEVQESAINFLNKVITNNTKESTLQSLKLAHLPQNLDPLRIAVCNCLENQRDYEIRQQQSNEKIKKLESQLTEKIEALEQYQPSESTVAVLGDRQLTYDELMNAYKQIQAQVDQYKQKDVAIEALNQALNSEGGESVLEALNGLRTLPEDVDHVKNALVSSLNTQKQLNEKKNELGSLLAQTTTTLQQYQPSQSTVAVLGDRLLTYDELINAYKQIQAQVDQYKQKDVAIEALNRALNNGSGERVLEALNGLRNLPEDLGHMKKVLAVWLNNRKQLNEEKNKLKSLLAQTTTALQKNEQPQSSDAVPDARQPTYDELMKDYKKIEAQVAQYEEKDVAIVELNQALNSGSGEKVLEALNGLRNLPKDVTHLKDCLGYLLNAKKELGEENEKLKKLITEYQTAEAHQIMVSEQPKNAIQKLNPVLRSFSEENISETLDQLEPLPEDVESVENSLHASLENILNNPVDSQQGGEEQPLAIEYSHHQEP